MCIRDRSNGEAWQYSKDYLFYIALGAPFILLANAFGHAVRGEGAAKASMIGGMIGTVVNIILDPVFILTFQMGTAGAAIATVLGNVFGCVYYLYYLTKKSPSMSCHIQYLKGCSPAAKQEMCIRDRYGIFQVGCDGLDARYRGWVFLIVYFRHISWIQTYLLRPCSVSAWRMKVVTREYVSSFFRTGLFLFAKTVV